MRGRDFRGSGRFGHVGLAARDERRRDFGEIYVPATSFGYCCDTFFVRKLHIYSPCCSSCLCIIPIIPRTVNCRTQPIGSQESRNCIVVERDNATIQNSFSASLQSCGCLSADPHPCVCVHICFGVCATVCVYGCLCMCVCMCVRERKGWREGERITYYTSLLHSVFYTHSNPITDI